MDSSQIAQQFGVAFCRNEWYKPKKKILPYIYFGLYFAYNISLNAIKRKKTKKNWYLKSYSSKVKFFMSRMTFSHDVPF